MLCFACLLASRSHRSHRSHSASDCPLLSCTLARLAVSLRRASPFLIFAFSAATTALFILLSVAHFLLQAPLIVSKKKYRNVVRGCHWLESKHDYIINQAALFHWAANAGSSETTSLTEFTPAPPQPKNQKIIPVLPINQSGPVHTDV